MFEFVCMCMFTKREYFKLYHEANIEIGISKSLGGPHGHAPELYRLQQSSLAFLPICLIVIYKLFI